MWISKKKYEELVQKVGNCNGAVHSVGAGLLDLRKEVEERNDLVDKELSTLKSIIETLKYEMRQVGRSVHARMEALSVKEREMWPQVGKMQMELKDLKSEHVQHCNASLDSRFDLGKQIASIADSMDDKVNELREARNRHDEDLVNLREEMNKKVLGLMKGRSELQSRLKEVIEGDVEDGRPGLQGDIAALSARIDGLRQRVNHLTNKSGEFGLDLQNHLDRINKFEEKERAEMVTYLEKASKHREKKTGACIEKPQKAEKKDFEFVGPMERETRQALRSLDVMVGNMESRVKLLENNGADYRYSIQNHSDRIKQVEAKIESLDEIQAFAGESYRELRTKLEGLVKDIQEDHLEMKVDVVNLINERAKKEELNELKEEYEEKLYAEDSRLAAKLSHLTGRVTKLEKKGKKDA